ncbi:MAG TPA: metalloregulator ArsR/SmtB family transcription factor [Candidatus Peribacteraceae bacterium]|nr:metalloregulator ArsR/SmtB family transcription factor [Candidatus Peribacteraceae bacterium]
MVKRYSSLDSELDLIFGALSDSTRRDILKRNAKKEMSVTDIAKPYDLSLPAVSKHLKVLENAKLIQKHRDGKMYLVTLSPNALMEASDYLRSYEALWNDRLDRLEQYLHSLPQ